MTAAHEGRMERIMVEKLQQGGGMGEKYKRHGGMEGRVERSRG